MEGGQFSVASDFVEYSPLDFISFQV